MSENSASTPAYLMTYAVHQPVSSVWMCRSLVDGYSGIQTFTPGTVAQ